MRQESVTEVAIANNREFKLSKPRRYCVKVRVEMLDNRRLAKEEKRRNQDNDVGRGGRV